MSSAISAPTRGKMALNLTILPYSLPDLEFFHSTREAEAAMCWIPDRRLIVLGRGSRPEDAFFPDATAIRGIPVMRRPSGGETVLLSPRTILIAAVKTGVKLQSPHRFFTEFNQKIIAVLRGCGVTGLNQRGTSDICIGGKKILGSSIYWHRDRLLYHAVLNVGEPLGNMDLLLKHPPREPDYRKGRSHSEFVTSLKLAGCRASVHTLSRALTAGLNSETTPANRQPGEKEAC